MNRLSNAQRVDSHVFMSATEVISCQPVILVALLAQSEHWVQAWSPAVYGKHASSGTPMSRKAFRAGDIDQPLVAMPPGQTRPCCASATQYHSDASERSTSSVGAPCWTRSVVSTDAVTPKATQEPQLPWSLIDVT